MPTVIGQTVQQPQKKPIGNTIILILTPILIIAGFIGLLIAVIALNKKPEAKRRPFNPLAVFAVTAVKDDAQLIVQTQGETRPRTEIDLVPEVSGKIVFVSPKFIQGGIFRKGDLLYQIDKSDYEVAVIRAQATVARAEQVLVREKAEAEVALRDWQDLGYGEASPLTLRKPQLAEAQAGLQSAKADLQNANIQLARTSVRAPFDGRVKTKTIDIGQYVGPGTPLGRIFSTDIAEVFLPLTDNDLAKLDLPLAFVAKDRQTAPEVLIRASIAGRDQLWIGRIMRTDSNYSSQTRTLNAIAEVLDPYGKGMSDQGVPLPPGLFVDAEIKGRLIPDIIVLPRDGLRPENKVYVAQQDGSAEIRIASVLDTTFEHAYLTDGVAPGDIVIVSVVEESRLVGPLKVLDFNDQDNILVDPPKPEWMKEEDAKKAKDKKADKKTKEKDRSSKTTDQSKSESGETSTKGSQ